MPLTVDFKEIVRARALRDPEFREALLREAVDCFARGEVALGETVLRDYLGAVDGGAAEYEVKVAAVRLAIDEGDASGVAKGNVLARVRKKLKLPAPRR